MAKQKQSHTFGFVLRLIVLVLLGVIGSLSFVRFDLTEEKKYTLTPATIDFLDSLDNQILIKVYLHGDFPADLKRLERATQELLNEFRSYSKSIEFQFINPSENPSKSQREKVYGELIESGLMYTNLPIETADGIQEKIVFPGALVSSGDRIIPVQLLKSKERVPNAVMINQSINNLEFEFMSALRKVQSTTTLRVALLEGNGCLSGIDIEDIRRSLEEFYTVTSIEINGNINALSSVIDNKGYRENNVDLVIVPKPSLPFSDKDKFILDQYIMHGGKVIWMLDAVAADMDSLTNKQQTIGTSLNTRLYDMLFTYGVRLNKNLVLDKTCAPVWLNVGNYGDRPNLQMFPWYFDPILIANSRHPIVNNIDPVLTRFTSSLDAVGDTSVKKFPLLQTSDLTMIYNAPARINLGIINAPLDFTQSAKPNQTVAMLLSGQFESHYAFSMPAAIHQADEIDFRTKSETTSMLVIGDGDVMRNPVNSAGNRFFPLGFDKQAGRIIYGNKDFLLNAVNFMLDDESLISVRSRTISLRKLNADRVLNEYRYWQAVNMVLPIAIIVVLGVILVGIRKRYYQ
jgi:ABC-2 type transport system permease protein